MEQKTGKQRTFTVPLVIQQYIENYCLRHRILRTAIIFPITERAVQKQLHIVCDYLGYDGISTHSFRKWYATEIHKQSGYDIALVQRLLQHSSAATTQRYIGIEPQRIEQAIENHTNLLSATRITPYSPKSTPWIYTIQLQYTIGLWDSNKRDRLGRSLFHSVFQSAGTFPLQQGVCNSFVTGCATVFYSVHEDLYTALRHLPDRLHHRG